MTADGGRRASNVLWIVGVSALAVFAAGFLLWMWALATSNGSPPPAEPAMTAMFESSLVYPNATHVQKVGQGTECRDGFWLPALIEFTFTTNDSTNDLFTWYFNQLEPRGWNGDIPIGTASGYSLTRETDYIVYDPPAVPARELDLFSIDTSFNLDGTPYRVGSDGTQFTTEFQHTFRSGRC